MKHLIIFIVVLLISVFPVNSQNSVKPAPAIIDIFYPGISHGIIDTITYNPKTLKINSSAFRNFASDAEKKFRI
jgi:hypothetical protein